MSNLITQEDNQTQTDLNQDEAPIVSGEYWIKKDTKELRLIVALNVIDNILHSIKVLTHPSRGENIREFTIDDFYDKFEYIPQDRVEEIRDAEIEQVTLEITELREALKVGYVDEEGNNVNKMLTSMAEQTKSNMSLPISMAQDNSVSKVKTRVEDVKALAEKQTTFIKDKSEQISKKSSLIGTFYKERAAQSLAAIDGTLQFVKKLNKGIHSLDIYLGEGVTILNLAEGESASKNDLVHFYQRKLFLDEEWFYNLEKFGADFRDLTNFKDEVAKDFSIVERMLPSPKSIVLMQYRRGEKRKTHNYSNDDVSFAKAFADMMQEIEEKQYNEECFLLIRNGKNLYMVVSDDIGKGGRLFPTSQEMKEIFKDGTTMFDGVEVDKSLSFKDGKNFEARTKADEVTTYYKRLLIMINGIQDREEIFGELKERNYDDWMSHSFQKDNFVFIHDDEDGLDYKSETLQDFVTRHNKNMKVGSRIVADWKNYMDEDTAPGMFSSPHKRKITQEYRPIETFEPQLIERVDGELCCYIKCTKGFDFGNNPTIRRIKVLLDGDGYYGRSDHLVIDELKTEDINYYLESRKHRTHYMYFARMLIAVKRFLEKEEIDATPSVNNLHAHVSSLYPEINKETIVKKLYESISFWRRKHKGEMLPIFNEDNKKVLKELSDIFFYKTIADDRESLKSYAEKENLDLIKISSAHNGKYYLYSVVKEEDKFYFGSKEKYPFIERRTLVKQRKGYKLEKKEQIGQDEYTIVEEVLQTFKELDPIQRRLKPIYNYPKKINNIHKMVEESALQYKNFIESDDKDIMLSEMLEDKLNIQKKDRGGYILPYFITFPVALYFAALHEGQDRYNGMRKNHNVLVEVAASLDALIARYGSQELYDKYLVWVYANYKNAESTVERLEKIRKCRGEVFSYINSIIDIYYGNIVRKKTDSYGALRNADCYSNQNISSENKEEPLNLQEYISNKREEDDIFEYKRIDKGSHE